MGKMEDEDKFFSESCNHTNNWSISEHSIFSGGSGQEEGPYANRRKTCHFFHPFLRLRFFTPRSQAQTTFFGKQRQPQESQHELEILWGYWVGVRPFFNAALKSLKFITMAMFSSRSCRAYRE
jgi:hypothetical protein